MPPKKLKAIKAPKAKKGDGKPKSKGAIAGTDKHDDTVPQDSESNVNNDTTINKSSKNQAAEQTTKPPISSNRKRKQPDSPSTATSAHKAPRRSARGRAAPSTPLDALETTHFLLSATAQALCQPQDETTALSQGGTDLKTYSTSATTLSAFEELLCAVILSRPISHRLGHRTIRTLLNAPYNFTTPAAIRAAGKEKRHQALWDARTQHKDKTAEHIGLLADVVAERFAADDDDADASLRKVREEAGYGVDEERALLRASIKGLGNTGLDIFCRRVQAAWPEVYPFVDQRTSASLGRLDLPDDGEGLRAFVEGNWERLREEDGEGGGGGDEETRRRRVFVRILERAVGCDLEGRVEEVREMVRKGGGGG